ncbi:hypothetical protein DKZ22_11120 [Limosilactobacillus reuteri]|uniref:Uncharacterized protein n=1 Tax=Limosilactobacillus reuteri TaxID=1598 RepID=A0A855X965_LIMRT|nr:hypothetical protein [Limosilactobacillus reuteri]PWT35870.1 hypothetical protein DKZ24_02140 [Limosilactobacillus reuteri]PWT39369.1 hypothetical protein DKZ22_11120 [Limosilactobacillus reuteri]PWT55385.1 hypothetical protein DKZ31_03405 [Limosilactobacillus reuteri]PWT61163.1 hypothetical protein DKZ30_01485 [Limosilactobacillus reuteri]PWT65623.1 hypothetical protein DKZ20_02500 [Limosilactobacillus reuteri]
MKIKEALNFINATTTVRAKVDDGVMYINEKLNSDDDWFMRISLCQSGWSAITADFDTCLDDDVDVMDLARVMDVVQRLICTPVNKRFLEKTYRLVVKRETSFHPKYVSNIITGFDELVFDLSKDEKEARIFVEEELNQIKEREPSLAPAIDAMKEEVKGDE